MAIVARSACVNNSAALGSRCADLGGDLLAREAQTLAPDFALDRIHSGEERLTRPRLNGRSQLARGFRERRSASEDPWPRRVTGDVGVGLRAPGGDYAGAV